MKKEKEKKNIKNFIKDYIVIIVLLFIVLVVLFIPKKKVDKISYTGEDQLKQICGLVTLHSIYHNVGKYSDDGFLFTKIGYKNYWLEFDSSVDVGIKCDNIDVKQSGNKITIKLPKATILSEPIPDNESMHEESESILTNISSEEKSKAENKATESVKDNIKKDEKTLNDAYERAKKFIKNYYEEIANYNGEKIIIEFSE